MKPESWFLLRFYAHYKNGFLPVAGGILDQANQFLQAMEIIDGAVKKLEAEKPEPPISLREGGVTLDDWD